ncbi:actinia tenebrosa protease inhibitors-like [Zootoca vivipara]|uniref:actinia tenebrosa protease inhibitors-like n=1 Tax=Zootoca vivipara TaxID=8524 RepID=UPI00293B9AED|nr:actinia tenebrosa protease inhibitors-like [Zootoca vivipara]
MQCGPFILLSLIVCLFTPWPEMLGISASDTETMPSKCTLPPEYGSCNRPYEAYYYDVKSKMCRTFIYSGCGGNGNNFNFLNCLEECKRFEFGLPICQQPLNTGSCEKSLHRFYYDAQTEKCKPFKYGGCNGNENNFRNKEECTDTCGPSAKTMPMKCTFPPEYGKCNTGNFYENYYYDVKSKMCRTFTYSGCGGNGNNFIFLIKCLTRVTEHSHQAATMQCNIIVFLVFIMGLLAPWSKGHSFHASMDAELPAKCRLRPRYGRCHSIYRNFYYDTVSGRCRTFSYSGCGGNRNNFLHLIDCEATCVWFGTLEGPQIY